MRSDGFLEESGPQRAVPDERQRRRVGRVGGRGLASRLQSLVESAEALQSLGLVAQALRAPGRLVEVVQRLLGPVFGIQGLDSREEEHEVPDTRRPGAPKADLVRRLGREHDGARRSLAEAFEGVERADPGGSSASRGSGARPGW